MLTLRRDREIFDKDGGWFRARWHFSFDHYQDPAQRGVGALRVFNDDRIVPGAAWPMHPHRDLESLTYVVKGHFEHADSLGNGGRLRAGGAQVMDFSHEGALHSERNASEHEYLRFLQFWVLPSDPALPTGVQQHQYDEAERADRWLQIMGPAGEDGLDLAQDARVQVTQMTTGSELPVRVDESRGGYLFVIDGSARLTGDPGDAGDAGDPVHLSAGDAARLEGPHDLTALAADQTELMLVDVPLRFRPTGVWAARQ